jgi:hypothetical protein
MSASLLLHDWFRDAIRRLGVDSASSRNFRSRPVAVIQLGRLDFHQSGHSARFILRRKCFCSVCPFPSSRSAKANSY